ncbi:MAG: recombination protein NinG [Bacteroidia bacterium]|nr:recombination protein NinG [Bacteroidia bacterium]
MTIEKSELTKCCDCNNDFRQPITNSTIKEKRCYQCKRLLEFNKSKERIEKNKILLSHSTFNRTVKRSNGKTVEYIPISHRLKKEAKKSLEIVNRKKSNIRNSADAYFSKFIRLKHSFESNGERFCICYTCGSCVKIKDAENGHWQRRGYYTTRFHEDNNRPQCHNCNYHHQGVPEKFELHLIEDLGQAKVDYLKLLSQTEGRDDKQFYQEKSDEYRIKLKNLIKELEIKSPWK